MKYNVDKEQFAKLLWDRPALIKKITSLDEDSAAFFVKEVHACYQHIAPALRASVKVVRAYIHEDDNTKNIYSRYCNRHFDFKLIPVSALAQLTTKERKDLIKRVRVRYNVYEYFLHFVNRLPNKNYEEWLEAVAQGYSIESVPEEYHTRKTLYFAMAKFYENSSCIPQDVIPEIFWLKDPDQANKDLVEALRISDIMIHAIPPKRITNEHMVAGFLSGSLDLSDEKFLEIPRCSWNRAVVSMALSNEANNIQIIPEGLLTEDDAISCADAEVSADNIPDSILTRKVWIHIVAKRNTPYDPTDEDDKKHTQFTDLKFQIDVAKHSYRGAKNLVWFIKPENREAILKVCPEFIRCIPKLEQTSKTIDTLLESASPEILDEISEFINLGKIKKEHAPLLVGCTSNLILSTMEKKFKGVTKHDVEHIETVKTKTTVEINVASVEFSKIRTQLDKNKV